MSFNRNKHATQELDLQFFHILGNMDIDEVEKNVREMEKMNASPVPLSEIEEQYSKFGVNVNGGKLFFMGKEVFAHENRWNWRMNYLDCKDPRQNGFKITNFQYKLVAMIGLMPFKWVRCEDGEYMYNTF